MKNTEYHFNRSIFKIQNPVSFLGQDRAINPIEPV